MNKKIVTFKMLLICILLFGISDRFYSQAVKTKNEIDSVFVLSGQKVKYYPFVSNKENSKYEKYYFPEMTQPNEELVRIVEKSPFPPQMAEKERDINLLLSPGYQTVETGYTVFQDGTSMISALTVMPGVTADMINWWFSWHALESARYRIWNPKVHLKTKLSDEDRKRLTNKNISNKERFWNTTHIVTEDVGMGMSTLKIHFISPEEFGFDMNLYKEPNVSTAICASISGDGLNGRFVHFVRSVPGGVEMRSRFYFEKGAPLEFLKGLNFHCIEEYTHLARILPQLYADFGKE